MLVFESWQRLNISRWRTTEMKFSIFLLATRYSQALSKIHKRCQNRMQGELGEIGTTLLWNGLSFFIIQKAVSTNVKFVELIFRKRFRDWPRNISKRGLFPNIISREKKTVSFFLRDVLLSCNTWKRLKLVQKCFFDSQSRRIKLLTFPNFSDAVRVPYLVSPWSYRIWWTADELNKAKSNCLSGPRFTQLREKLAKFKKCHGKAILPCEPRLRVTLTGDLLSSLSLAGADNM